jgi:hypothetical protein
MFIRINKMKNKEHIHQKVAATFKVLETIEKVPVNHFFKHKILQKIEAQKEAKNTIFSWFTPQLQLATLGLILLLNTSAIIYSYNSVENTSSVSDIDSFAQEYSLKSNSNSILN